MFSIDNFLIFESTWVLFGLKRAVGSVYKKHYYKPIFKESLYFKELL